MLWFAKRSTEDTKPLKTKKIRVSIGIVLSIYIVTTILTTMFAPAMANAVNTSSKAGQNDLNWQIQSFLYYRAIGNCFKYALLTSGSDRNNYDQISPKDAASGKWFNVNWPSGITPLGMYMRDAVSGDKFDVGDDGKVNCSEDGFVNHILNFWGINYTDFLCNSGFHRAGQGENQDLGVCKGATSANFEWTSKKDTLEKFAAYLSKQVYGDSKYAPVLTDPQWYLFYRHTLDQSCIPGIDKDRPSQSRQGKDVTLGYNDVKWFDIDKLNNLTEEEFKKLSADDLIVTGSYFGALKQSDDIITRPGGAPDYVDVHRKCSEAVANMNSYAKKFAQWNISNYEAAVKVNTGPTPSSGGGDSSSCAIGGIGWVVCPVMEFIAGINDVAFNFLADNFLKVNTGLVSQDQSSYTAWSAMRNIANVAFVIVFLIIIFSQLSNVAITNYGVKKLLPRLIIAAILVNISFFICQVAVDLSNIIGKSLYDIFGLIPTVNEASGNANISDTNGLAGWTTIILGAGGVLAGGAMLLMAISLPVILASLLALLMIVLILILRIALIVMLVVISPLAFVAFLLPNTENLFKKWYKAFGALLLVYPIVGVVFGASIMAAGIINSIGAEEENMVMQIVAMGVAAIPLFIVPGILKGAMNAAGSVGTKLAGMSSKANSRIGKKVDSTTTLGSLNRSLEQGRARRRTRFQGRIAKAIPGQTGRRMQAAGEAAALQGESEDLKIEQMSLQREMDSKRAKDPNFNADKFLKDRIRQPGMSRTQKSAAMHQLAASGRDGALRELRSDSSLDTKDREALQRAITTNAGALVTKAPDLIKGPDAAFSSVKGADLAGFSGDTGRVYMEHLRSLHAKATAASASSDDIAALDAAVSSFNSSVEDITADSGLQAAFSGDTGTGILKVYNASDPLFKAFASSNLPSLAAIQSDGKIR